METSKAKVKKPTVKKESKTSNSKAAPKDEVVGENLVKEYFEKTVAILEDFRTPKGEEKATEIDFSILVLMGQTVFNKEGKKGRAAGLFMCGSIKNTAKALANAARENEQIKTAIMLAAMFISTGAND